jgi:hypothetical protein
MKTSKKYKPVLLIGVLLVMMVTTTSCFRQQVIINQIPLNTPPGSSIFITGNFNNWDPGDNRFRMQQDSAGRYVISLPRGVGRLEYKFTRGDWTTVEKNECGYDIENRSLQYGENEITTNSIEGWGDTEPMNCIQKTIVLRNLPENTPDNQVFYFASNINNWNPGDVNFIFQIDKQGTHFLTLDKISNCLNYKITMGSWETVETSAENFDIDNREICFNNSDTVYLDVASWKSLNVRKIRSQVIVLEKIPAATYDTDQIFIAGSFNNWDPGHKSYRFIKDNSGRWFFKLTAEDLKVSFKITRGNWRSVETNISGSDIDDRSLIFGQVDTLYLQVERWKDR